MNNWEGILSIKVTDNIDEVGLKFVSKNDDYEIMFPSLEITNEELKAHPYFRFYRVSPIMELAYGAAGLQFAHMSVAEGRYPDEVYSSAIPYLMGRIAGNMLCPVNVMWELIRKHDI